MGDCPNKVREILKETLGIDSEQLSDSDPLFSSGLVDSFSLLELITVMEARFSITISAQDTTIEHLDTITGICALISSLQDSDG